MKRYINSIGLMACLVFIVHQLPAQDANTARLNISEVKVSINNGTEQIISNVATIYVTNKNTRQDIELFKNEDLQISIDIKVSSNNSRRSSTKSGAINVDVTYFTTYKGKKDKRTARYIFYIDDERKFTAKEQFVFKNGLKANQVKLTYTCQFVD